MAGLSQSGSFLSSFFQYTVTRRAGITKMDEDFPKVIRMPRNSKQASVTDSFAIVLAPKPILFRIAHRLDPQTDRIHDHSRNVPPGAKSVL